MKELGGGKGCQREERLERKKERKNKKLKSKKLMN
jgi:hypothetical protein